MRTCATLGEHPRPACSANVADRFLWLTPDPLGTRWEEWLPLYAAASIAYEKGVVKATRRWGRGPYRIRSRLIVFDGTNWFDVKKCMNFESCQLTKVYTFCTPSCFR